jgi:restriction endonuclease S subunit
MRDGWTETTLGDVVELGKGGAWGADEIEPNRVEAICLRGTDLADLIDKKHPEAPVRWLTPTELKKAVCAPNMVLIETSGSKCGRSVVLTAEMLSGFALPVVYSNFCRTLRIDTRLLSSRYVEMWFSHKYEAGVIPSYRATSAMPNLDVKSLLRMETIAVPPLVEQKRIVDVVSSVDAYIDALQQQADMARTARNAVLHELLSVGGDDWTKMTLGDISDVAYGYTESASETEVGPKFLRITDIQNGNVDWSLVPYCPIEKKQYEKQRLQNGDIVFARTGATTGKSFLILNPPPAVCASYLIRLRPAETTVIPYFLNLNFQTDEYWINIKSGMSGSAQGGFNASKLSSLSVSLPPIEGQKRIVETVSSMDEVIQATEQAISEAKNLRSGLLSDLLSGEHGIPASYDSLLGAA